MSKQRFTNTLKGSFGRGSKEITIKSRRKRQSRALRLQLVRTLEQQLRNWKVAFAGLLGVKLVMLVKKDGGFYGALSIELL